MSETNHIDDTDCDPAVSCAACKACCCRLEVMLMGDDDVPAELTLQDAWGGWVMRRLDDGWCAALERDTMRCSIYGRRPGVCLDYQMGGSDCIVERSRLLTPAPDGRADIRNSLAPDANPAR